jgi:outer membrane protein TolC
VRQAQASAVIAGAPLLPELQLGLDASRQRLLRGDGNDQLDASSSERTSTSFGTRLSASYEIDFCGLRAARDSALRSLDASRFERQTVELTLVSAVADSYLQGLALEEQLRIARLNLDNARDVLGLVETRERAGSATRLELAQQRSLVAAQSASCRCSSSAARTTASPWPPCWVIQCSHCLPATRRSARCAGR